MSDINSYKDLLIWQKGVDIVANTYLLTQDFPKEEVYALTSQIKRAAVSIPSNIAEGYGRKSTQSYIHFVIFQEDHYLNWKHNYMLQKS
jgi:four helix bundle protein